MRVTRPPMKELDAFHVALYRVYHHDLAAQAWPAVAASAGDMAMACQALAAAPLPKRFASREAEVRPEIGALCAKSDRLKTAAAGTDHKATATAVEAVHAQYEKVEGLLRVASAADGERRHAAGCYHPRPAGELTGGPDDVREARSTTGRIRRVAAAVLAVAAAGAGLASVACTHSAPARRLVAATVFPIFDLTQRVAGDRIDVRLVLAPGLDPHDYEPRPKDVAGLSDASLIFAVGLGLDPWAPGLARSAGAGEARVFDLGPLMDPILAPPGLIRPEPLIDPHFWTDPVRAQRAVDVIVEALSGLDPEGGPFYRERGGAVKRSIQAVHEDVSRQAGTWQRRRLVTFHGSLFYFAARYGLQVVGVVQPVPGTEPTAQHMAALVAQLRGPDPAILFREPQMESQLATALAREAGVTVYEVDPMGGGPKAASYEELVRGIARTMDEALR